MCDRVLTLSPPPVFFSVNQTSFAEAIDVGDTLKKDRLDAHTPFLASR